jgi:hypothetical protein
MLWTVIWRIEWIVTKVDPAMLQRLESEYLTEKADCREL